MICSLNTTRIYIILALVICVTGIQLFQLLTEVEGFLGIDAHQYIFLNLQGRLWFTKNQFQIPEYTPFYCGGFPYFADPQSSFYSLTQLWFLVLSPIDAYFSAIISHFVIGVLGYFYLLRRGFRFSEEAALLAAIIASTNGAFIERMMAGQLSFLSLSYIPVLYGILLDKKLQNSAAIILSGILVAAFIHSGGHYTALFALIGFPLMIILASALDPSPGRFAMIVIRSAGAGALGLCISCSKLIASSLLMQSFSSGPVSDPPIELGFFGGLILTIANLFVPGAYIPFPNPRTNFDCSIVLPAGVLVIVGGYFLVRTKVRERYRGKKWLVAMICAGGLLYSSLIVMLVSGDRELIHLIREVPLLSKIREPMRLVIVFVPPVIVLSAYALQKAHSIWRVLILLAFFLSSVWRMAAYKEAEHYVTTSTDGLSEFEARFGNQNPETWELQGVVAGGRNDLKSFMDLTTSILCYGAFFEFTSNDYLKLGEVESTENGKFNLKNPACYLFPEENKCRPGDLLSSDDRVNAEALMAFRPVYWQQSTRYKVSVYVSLLTLILLLVLGALKVLGYLRK